MELTVLAKLSEFADQQFGFLTRQQVAIAGARADELIASGIAEWVLREEVLRLRAGGRTSYPRLYAAWLRLAPATPAAERSPPSDGVVSHSSALLLYQVAGEPGPEAEFTVPEGRAATIEAGVGTLLHAGHVSDSEWTYLAGLPVTTPGRTLLDLSARYDVDELARMAASLVGQQWVSEPDLRAALTSGAAGLPGHLRSSEWVAAVLAEAGPS